MTESRDRKCTYVYVDSPKNREKERVGQKCGFWAEDNGTGRCKFHGGRNEALIAATRRARIRAEIEAEPGFVGLWPEDHELLDPFSLLLWEIRRSGHRIEYLSRKIAELKEEKDLWWGKTKQEKISATEFAGVNTTYEAREHVLIKMQNDERKTLFALTKEWQGQKFEAARIAGMGAFAAAAKTLVRNLVEQLGHDLSDPEIQDVIERVLLNQPPLPIER